MSKALLIIAATMIAIGVGREVIKGVTARAQVIEAVAAKTHMRIDCAHTQEGCHAR